jgi:hypothetical protein
MLIFSLMLLLLEFMRMKKLVAWIFANQALHMSLSVLVQWRGAGRFSCSSDVFPRREDEEEVLEMSFLRAYISSFAVLLLFPSSCPALVAREKNGVGW